MSTDETEVERLRRQVRAMGAVNRQLHAQLEGGMGADITAGGGGDDLLAAGSRGYRSAGSRRASEAAAWVQQLERHTGGGQPFLVRGPNGSTYVVEGTFRREVRAGLLVPALERLLGEARPVGEGELGGWSESAPVEVLEGPKGSPFVIVGGKRWPVRGLPLPHPVSAELMQLFPEGVELNVAASNVSRTQFERAVTGRYHVDRVKALLRRQGTVTGARTLARKAGDKVRKSS